MNKLIQLLIIGILFSYLQPIYAQECGTELTQEQIDHMNATRDERDAIDTDAFDGMTHYIPIQVHIIRDDSGDDGLSLSDLNTALTDLNERFESVGFVFTQCEGINYVDNDDYAIGFQKNSTEENELIDNHFTTNAINIYFIPKVKSGSASICGYATFPYRTEEFIVVANGCADNSSTLAHEMGHYFNLYHTHQGRSDALMVYESEWVDGSNCGPNVGDELCDTPADPRLSTGTVNSACEYTGSAVDDNGDPYNPDPTNVMAYGEKYCRTNFSSQQIDRMIRSYMTDRSHLQCGGNLPDLVVIDETINTTSVTAGGSVFVTSKVKNEGSAPSNSSGLGYYLSNNRCLDDNDILLYTDGVNALGVNATDSESQVLNIPSNTSAGTWYILFYADRSDVVLESNEVNNFASIEFQVIGSGFIDLIVENTSVNKITVEVGEELLLSSQVTNIGNQASNGSRLGYYLSTDANYDADDLAFQDDGVISLDPNESDSETQYITIPNGLTPGTYYILFRADRRDDVNESNENNNVAYEQITVIGNVPQADLVVGKVTVGQTNVNAGENLYLTALVDNIGDASTGTYSYIAYYLSSNPTYEVGDTYLDRDFVKTLVAGATSSETETITIPSNTASGTWYILYRADYNSRIGESNENNNVAYKQITIGDNNKPDLIVENQTVNMTSVEAGSTIYVTSTVKNIGNSSTDDHSYLAYYLSDNTTYGSSDMLFSSDYVNELSAGQTDSESQYLTIPSYVTSGVYYLLFRADRYDDIDESDENNNVSFIQIYVSSDNNKTTIEAENPIVESSLRVYPNPFFQEANIEFTLIESAEVSICIYDVTGKQIRELLVQEPHQAGTYQLSFEGDGLSEGIYYIHVLLGTEQKTLKLLLQR